MSMSASTPLPLACGNELVTFDATIAGTNVTFAGVEYRIEVGDGYVTEMTPTLPVVVRKVLNHAVGSVRIHRHGRPADIPVPADVAVLRHLRGRMARRAHGLPRRQPLRGGMAHAAGRRQHRRRLHLLRDHLRPARRWRRAGVREGNGQAHSGSEEATGTFRSATRGHSPGDHRRLRRLHLHLAAGSDRRRPHADAHQLRSGGRGASGRGQSSPAPKGGGGWPRSRRESASDPQALTCATPLSDVHGAVAGNLWNLRSIASSGQRPDFVPPWSCADGRAHVHNTAAVSPGATSPAPCPSTTTP